MDKTIPYYQFVQLTFSNFTQNILIQHIHHVSIVTSECVIFSELFIQMILICLFFLTEYSTAVYLFSFNLKSCHISCCHICNHVFMYKKKISTATFKKKIMSTQLIYIVAPWLRIVQQTQTICTNSKVFISFWYCSDVSSSCCFLSLEHPGCLIARPSGCILPPLTPRSTCIISRLQDTMMDDNSSLHQKPKTHDCTTWKERNNITLWQISCYIREGLWDVERVQIAESMQPITNHHNTPPNC